MPDKYMWVLRAIRHKLRTDGRDESRTDKEENKQLRQREMV